MRRNVWIVSLLFACGCGGGSTEPTQESTPPVTTGGDEQSTPDETPETHDAPPPAAGPATVRIVVKVDGHEVPAEVTLTDAAGATVAQGAAGATFNVTSGTFSATAHITDATVIINRPTQNAGPFEVAPGAEHVQTFELERAQVHLIVNQRGRPVRGARITLRRQNAQEDPIELRVGDEQVPFLPGRYDATVRFGSQSIEVTGLMFMGGAVQNVPINVN